MSIDRRKLFIMLLIAGVLAGAPWAITQAVWTDSEDVTGNTFTTGDIDISTSPASAMVSFTNMVPGDTVTAPLTVSNDGSIELRYAMTTAIIGSATLSDGLELQIKSGVTTCTAGGFGADGTSLYNSTLTSGALGNPAQGAHGGDRTLSASASEVLCFQVRLPTSAGNGLQGLTTTATFTFAAEQTANNP